MLGGCGPWPDGAVHGIRLVAASRIRRRWAGLIWIGLLAGLVGGLATGAVAGLRRTESAAERLIDATDAPDAWVFSNSIDEGSGRRLRSLVESRDDVAVIWPLARFIGRTTDSKDWYFPLAGPARSDDIYQPILEDGRLPQDDQVDEIAITVQTSRNTGLEVGSRFQMDVYTAEQMATINDDSEVEPNGAHLDLEVVGIVRDPADIALAATDRFMIGTPALYEAHGDMVDASAGMALRMRDGAAGLDRLRADLEPELPPGMVTFRTNREALAAAEVPTRVLRIGALILAAIVAGVGLIAVAQATRRHVSQSGEEEATLAAMGFTRGDRIAAAALPGGLSALVAGVTAVLVGIAVSPAFPLGRPSILEPEPGLEVNVAVLAVGGAVTVLMAVLVFSVVASVELRTVRPRLRRPPSRAMRLLGAVAPAPVLLGARLAVEGGRRREGVSGRSAMVGAALGIAGLVASLTFARSVDHLVVSPAIYGLDFDISMEVPVAALAERRDALAADPELEAVAEQWGNTMLLEGQPVSAIAMTPAKGSIRPVVRTGRLPEGDDELALGPGMAKRLGVDLGDHVRVGETGEELTLVGTILAPQTVAADYRGGVLVQRETLEAQGLDAAFPLLIARYAPGVDAAEKTAELDGRYPWGVMDESLTTPPSELRNLADVGAVPRILQWFFAALIVAALGNGLLMAGRRHRHVLGIVRSLGFTRSQVRATMAAMAATMGLVAVAVGLPLGLVAGSAIWAQVSDTLSLTPVVSWPFTVALLLTPIVVGLGALIATWPAQRAIARHPAEILRAE